MNAIVSVRGLSKWYGKVIGLNNFNIDIGKGITGIVGPNGSGKSTFFKLLTGNIKANTGHLSVFGEDPWRNPAQLMRIGFCPDYDFLPGELTGREYLRFVGGIHAMSGNDLATRADEVLGIVNMKEAADRRMGGYSKGMRQRLKIAGCLLHDPPLLLLDEPLTGTDPVARKDLIDLILKLHQDHGHDIIVSSHVLHEVERLTRNIAIIYKGRAVATGGPYGDKDADERTSAQHNHRGPGLERSGQAAHRSKVHRVRGNEQEPGRPEGPGGRSGTVLRLAPAAHKGIRVRTADRAQPG